MVILVTGASRGIGREIAKSLAQKGNIVIANYNKSEKQAQILKKESENIDIFKADVSKRDEVKKLVEYVVNKYGKIDVLINNAGISESKLFTEVTDQDWQKVINNNLYSYMNDTSEWLSIIENTSWKYGIAPYVANDDSGDYAREYNGDNAYSFESIFQDTIDAKIGGLYLHDYFYAYPEGNPQNFTAAKSAWIHYENNDSNYSSCTSTGFPEIIMTGAGYGEYLDDGQKNYGWAIWDNGKINVVIDEALVRPVFYLKSDIEIYGKGLIDDPFIIK